MAISSTILRFIKILGLYYKLVYICVVVEHKSNFKTLTMNTEQETLSAAESLNIITKMINQAKGNVQRSSFHFLLWGWVVALANMGMYTLIQLDYRHPYIVWLITIPAWIASMVYGYRQGRGSRTVTYIGKTIMWLWISFGVSVFILVFFGASINFNLNPVILLISTIPTLATGVLIKFKPLILGAISFWIFGILCFMVGLEYQNLIGAAAVIVGYLIPGYMLKYKKD